MGDCPQVNKMHLDCPQVNRKKTASFSLQFFSYLLGGSPSAFCLLGDSPGAFTKNFIQVHGHRTGCNKSFNLSLLSWRQDPHESLGSKPVLCPLLMISLGHVAKHDVSSLVKVMDDLAKVTLEILGCKTLQVGESCWRNVSLP